MPRLAKGGPRDSVISVRIPARLRFGLELTARLYNEAMTDVIVRALDDALTSENGGLFVRLRGQSLPVNLLPRVWDEREAVRLVKLALVYPALLSLKESKVWEAVRASDKYWATPTKNGPASKGGLKIVRRIDDLRPDVLERDWAALAGNLDGT